MLAGNLATSILQTGSVEQVRQEVKRCLQSGMKHPGGFILMPACEIPPDMPRENMDAIAEALSRLYGPAHGYAIAIEFFDGCPVNCSGRAITRLK